MGFRLSTAVEPTGDWGTPISSLSVSNRAPLSGVFVFASLRQESRIYDGPFVHRRGGSR